MALAGRILAIRKSPWKAAVYIPLTVVLAILIFLGLVGLIIFLLPFFLFAIPYWFGERRVRRMAVVGPVVTLAVVASLATIVTYINFSSTIAIQRSADGKLSQGMVSPPSGTPNSTLFNFTILYNSRNTPAHPPMVNITSISLGSAFVDNHTMMRGGPTSNGSKYFYTTTLDNSLHVFHFALQSGNGSWIETRDVQNSDAIAVGPFTASYFTSFAVFFVVYLLRYFVIALILFYIILGLYAWSRRARERRQALLGGPAKAPCPNCRAAVPEGATECPVCGKPLAGAKGQG